MVGALLYYLLKKKRALNLFPSTGVCVAIGSPLYRKLFLSRPSGVEEGNHIVCYTPCKKHLNYCLPVSCYSFLPVRVLKGLAASTVR